MANQRLIDKLLKRQEEETKIEVDLKGLADTPFIVKLDKETYKELQKEASESKNEKEVPFPNLCRETGRPRRRPVTL